MHNFVFVNIFTSFFCMVERACLYLNHEVRSSCYVRAVHSDIFIKWTLHNEQTSSWPFLNSTCVGVTQVSALFLGNERYRIHYYLHTSVMKHSKHLLFCMVPFLTLKYQSKNSKHYKRTMWLVLPLTYT